MSPQPLPLPHLETALQPLDTIGGADPFSNLPTFIARPQQVLRPEELRFLEDSGALTVPHSDLRDQLLLSFVLYVDPHLPVVDIQALLDAIEGRSSDPVSLLLFQAVMFAGSHFVDMGFLEEVGFKTRVVAKTYYFRQIKVLRDLAWESDRLTVLQATLLHQWWWTSSSELEDPWYWLGVCISLATGIGINHPSTHAVKEERTRRLWKRIWWVCITRDRTFGMVQRKPMRIKDEDIALPPLNFRDFETNPLRTAIPTLAQSFSVTDCVNKVLLADIFMSQTNLLLIAGRILDCSYNLQGFLNSTSAWYLFYTPKQRQELDQDQLGHLLEELDTWSGQLNRNCRLKYSHDAGTDADTDEKLADNVHVSRAALRLSYLLAQELFHRPLAFTPERDQRPDSQQDYSESSSTVAARSRVSEAASEIAEIITTFHRENSLGYLPPLAMTCIMTAVAWFLMELRWAQKSPADLPGHQYHQCIRAFSKFKDSWPIWDETFALLKVMAIQQHVWFARTMAMLSKSVPMIPSPSSTANSVNGSTASKSRSRTQGQETRSALSNPPPNMQTASDFNTDFGLHTVGYRSNGGQHAGPYVDLRSSAAPIIMAPMHPFSFTATDLGSIDAIPYGDLSMDHALDAYGLGDTISSVIFDFPAVLSQDIEEYSTIPATVANSGRTGLSY
ncbi:hypothetical protein H2200_010866 [Cladophialophora chaetospira]|uniref:Xylanolytic transcriptional activator regulatory domain-containing protein n=1 Tax=Cladophialophora chaetospira TaxID=386627 RepID=A0AA38X0X2_9EURO|nr:hypothetical protein H2200_010866 [Cladophialophora chaetospira]